MRIRLLVSIYLDQENICARYSSERHGLSNSSAAASKHGGLSLERKH